ncbi:MAG: hypothetical protein OER98_16675 [Gammaproteobacteria bacterium]|nr:hypothetical protein [Gammaproteobacteria bacterium]
MKPQHVPSQPISNNVDITIARTTEQHILISVQWVLTTTWFLLFLVAIFVGISFLASLSTDAWHWFQRSGALMVSIGVVLSTRRPLSLILESMIDDHGRNSLMQSNAASSRSELGELKTCVCGFIMVAMGTLIWAYGDLLGCLLDWNTSCLI